MFELEFSCGFLQSSAKLNCHLKPMYLLILLTALQPLAASCKSPKNGLKIRRPLRGFDPLPGASQETSFLFNSFRSILSGLQNSSCVNSKLISMRATCAGENDTVPLGIHEAYRAATEGEHTHALRDRLICAVVVAGCIWAAFPVAEMGLHPRDTRWP